MQQNLKVRSGNRIEVRFDGQVVGLIQNVTMNDSYGLEPASGVGDIHAVENVPTMARHSISVQSMILRRKSMRQAGIGQLNGDEALKGLVFDFIVIDKDNGQVLRTYSGCSYDSGSTDIRKHAILMENATFLALDVQGDGV